MCDSCGCNGDVGLMSAPERVKAESNDLRGTIGDELLEDTPIFSDDAGVLLKFQACFGVRCSSTRGRRDLEKGSVTGAHVRESRISPIGTRRRLGA